MSLGKETIKKIIEEEKLESMGDLEDYIRGLSKEIIESMLDGELSAFLGYDKHDHKKKQTSNSRNGHLPEKTLRSNQGELKIKTPRDRNAEFEPFVVPKGVKTLGNLPDKVIAMYARGMSDRDISSFIKDIYGIRLSSEGISNIVRSVSARFQEWQSRPLPKVYAIIYLDTVVYKVRLEGVVRNLSVKTMIGIDLEGRKQCLGFWSVAQESARFWLQILNSLKSRGLKDVLIFSADGLTGLNEAIQTAFPASDTQRCIVHQIRNSIRYVSYKDRKELCQDLKRIYRAVSEQAARAALDYFAAKWDDKYSYIAKSWYQNWDELATYFKYPSEIRRLIYTTNPIENFHRSLRKVTKSKGSFPNEEALFRLLFLVAERQEKKWQRAIPH